MPAAPRISVAIPALNRENHVAEAVESIVAQTFADWELLISDGGSTDATPRILESLAQRDKRIRIFSHPGTNVAEARNALLAEARGELVAIMDSDDVSLPDRLARQCACLDAHSDLGGIGGGLEFIDGAGVIVESKKFPMRSTDPDELCRLKRAGWAVFVHPAMLFRRRELEKIGGYRNLFRHAEDEDLFLRLLDVCRLGNVAEKVIRYRWDGNNASSPSLEHQIYRTAALASAHLRLAGLADAAADRKEPVNYLFLHDMLDRLGDKALPVWLFWIGMLQHYRCGAPGILAEAWAAVETLPHAPEWRNEVERHRRNRCG